MGNRADERLRAHSLIVYKAPEAKNPRLLVRAYKKRSAVVWSLIQCAGVHHSVHRLAVHLRVHWRP